ncbi:MAG: VanW family protein [Sandaracinaceae bacterium]|nr:VanW family protein [Sandaracinaceae bacterium]
MRAAALVGLILALAIGAVGGWLALAPADGRVARGVLLEGTRLESTDDPGEIVRERATRWLDEEIWLEAGHTTDRLRRVELGYAIDVDACTRELLAIGRSGDPLDDLLTRLRARQGAVRVSLAHTLDPESVRVAITSLAGRFDRAAAGARIDDAGHLAAPAEPGRSIDVEASLALVLAGLERGELRFELLVRAEAPPLDPTQIARASEPVVVGRFLTRYRMRGDEGPRAVNVRVAAEALDGAVIPPGGRFSFNERVGPRTIERGYRVAHVIYDGEMIDGIGGGVCQVASTLHAAAFLGGLEIDEHSPHSRPSTYIPMGLDATVVYPDVDLVLGNPLPAPITIRAHAAGGQLEITLSARARPIEVDWRREVLARTSYEERVIEDASVAPGEARVTQEGGPGFVIERVRTIERGTGVLSERRTLRYPPTDRIVRVAPGYSFDSATGAVSVGASAVPAAAVSSPVSSPSEGERAAAPPSSIAEPSSSTSPAVGSTAEVTPALD